MVFVWSNTRCLPCVASVVIVIALPLRVALHCHTMVVVASVARASIRATKMVVVPRIGVTPCVATLAPTHPMPWCRHTSLLGVKRLPAWPWTRGKPRTVRLPAHRCGSPSTITHMQRSRVATHRLLGTWMPHSGRLLGRSKIGGSTVGFPSVRLLAYPTDRLID